MINKKNVAVIGGGFEQLDGIKNLKKKFKIYGFDDDNKAIGKKYFDVAPNIKIKDKKIILNYLKKKNILSVFSFCSERTLSLVSYLSLNLNNNNIYGNLLKKCINKNTFRISLSKYGVNNPQFSILKSKKQIKENKILKPLKGSGSKGILIINKKNKQDIKIDKFKNYLIEDYIQGNLFAIEGFCIKKKFHGLALSRKYRDKISPLIDKKIVFNYQNKKLFKKAIDLGQKCCTAVSAENVPIHLEFISSKSGNLYPIDFAVRGAGYRIFNYCLSKLLSHNSSDYQIKLQLNKSIKIKKINNIYFYLYFLTANKKKYLKKINLEFFENKKIKFRVFYNKKIGDLVLPPKSTHDRVGVIIFTFEKYSALKEKKKLIENYFKMIGY